MNKPFEDIKKRYWKEVGKLSDDTGYFDHEFVLNFLSDELVKQKQNLKKKVEGLKDKDEDLNNGNVFLDGYNQALDQVLELLEEE